MPTSLHRPVLTAMALSLALALPAHAGEAQLLERIDQLAAELEAIKAELAATRQKTDATAQKQEALAVATPAAPAVPSWAASTVLSSYGEINYTRPKNARSQAQADVARAVLGISHRFDDKTKMVAEFEWEHAVTSASDQGEAAVEQIYVEHELDNGLRVKGGLFLMPVGLLNTNHEPTAYFGVQRNFVETAIIPSTWREAGIGVSNTHDNGLTWDAGLTTGFDLTKWDAASTEGLESPLGSIHQEGQLAKAGDLGVHAAVNWRGVPGLLLGGSVFTGKAGHGTPGFVADDARVTLWDLHTRYTPGRWDLSALYTRGTISHTAALNTTFVGQPTPVPSAFFGWYAQAAYQLWKTDAYRLSPFVRLERLNTARRYSELPQGLGVSPTADDRIVTLGASFFVGEGVVVKADFQKFKLDSDRDRFNLGLGYAF